jgi:chromosome partitioning protein
MPVITIGNTKGGSGKTTAVIVLATSFAAKGLKVAVIDGDPDQTLCQWYARWAKASGCNDDLILESKTNTLAEPHSHANLTAVPHATEDNMDDLIGAFEESHDVVLVDLQGSANRAMMMAFGHSDLAIVPAQASAFDGAGLLKTIKVIRAASKMARRSIKEWVLLTRTGSTIKSKVDRHTRSEVANLGLNVFDVELCQWTGLQQMTYAGTPPDKGGAVETMAALTKEVLQVLQDKKSPTVAAE